MMTDISSYDSCTNNRQNSPTLAFGNHHRMPNNWFSRHNSGCVKTCPLVTKENELKRQCSQRSNISTEEEPLFKDSYTLKDNFIINLTKNLTQKVDNSLSDERNNKGVLKSTSDEWKESIGLKKLDKGYSEDIGKENVHSENTKRYQKRIFAMSTSACLMSTVAIFIVIFIFTEMPIFQSGTRAFSPLEKFTSGLVDSGNFKLDQYYLKNFHQIRWLPDDKSILEPTGNGSCLRVPTCGNYLVVSRFTFIIPPETKTTGVIHYFRLLNTNGAIKDGGYKRKYVNVAEKQPRLVSNDTEDIARLFRISSVFTEVIYLESQEELCADVSDPDLIYISPLDNDLNIIRV